MKKSLRALLAEYGVVAMVVYLTIFALTLTGFAVAIRLGWRPRGIGGGVGVFAAAFIATKLTQPIRIIATVALTPVVAKLYERVTGRPRSGSST